jgi:polar amino acid transport system substrate-binding protein
MVIRRCSKTTGCGAAVFGAALALSILLAPGRCFSQPAHLEELRQRFSSAPLRWGGDAEGGAPFQLRDPRDPSRVIGFEVELVEALAEVLSAWLGITIQTQFVQYEWVSLQPGLLTQDDFDIIVSGFEITPERQRELLFSRPYYVYSQQLVVRAEESEIRSLEDCRGRPMSTLSGSAAEAILEEAGITDVTPFDGQVEPYLELELGRVDAVLLDLPIATYYARPNPKLKFVGPPLGHGWYGIGLRKIDGTLRDALDAALSEIMISGKMRDIYRRWHLWNADQAKLAGGPRQAEELAGLGFDERGIALSGLDQPPADAVAIDIMASAAKLWTLDQYGPLLIQAAGMTVLLTIASMAVAMALGLLVAIARLYGNGPLRWLALVYVEFFRGTPLLLILFFLYFGLSAYGIQMPAVLTAIIGFGLNYAAYEAEIYRSSIQSIPLGQWEAGRALGMSEALTFRRVIFPQALRIALGPMTNDFVALFKDTSLVSVIAVRELTKEYLILSRSSLKFVELGLLTAALYLMMSVPAGYLARYLEKRWGPGR